MQNKSKSALIQLICGGIATFNAETARYAEKNGTVLRANIRENELSLFYGLLDKYPSKVVGALLASYGFALTEKEANKAGAEEQIESEESTEEV